MINDISNTITDSSMIYIGSHNFSSSAWGKVDQYGYSIRNWELGVMFPPGLSAKIKENIVNDIGFNIKNPKKY